MEAVIINKNRLDYIDVAKFISMFFVILCHVISSGEIRHIGYSFHLPLFFILNGVTLKIKENESFGQFLEKKIKSYIVPMFWLGLILIFVEIIQSQSYNNPLDLSYLGTMLIKMLEQKRVYPIWFVGALFFSDIFFYFIHKLSKNKSLLILIFSLFFLAIAIICNIHYRYHFAWNIDVSLFGVFFVSLGYLFSHKDSNKIKNFVLKNKIYSLGFGIILFAIGQLLGEYNYHTYNSHLEMWGMNYTKYYLTIPCAILSSFGIILISNSIKNKVLAELGKTTLVLLAFHQIVTIPLFNQTIAPSWYNQIKSLDGNSIEYLLFSLTSTLFSIVSLVGVYYFIIYSPFSFVLNKKMKPFYKKLFTKKKMKVKLIKLTKEYYKQLAEMIDEWTLDQKLNNTNHSPWAIFKNDYHDFDYYLENLEHKEAANDKVPDSVFFLLDEERNILLGAVNIRHYLNDYLLKYAGHIGDGIRPSERRKGYATEMIRLALIECKKLGINRVLMICDKTNIASAKSIINNGGVLENEFFENEKVQQRYWIEIK